MGQPAARASDQVMSTDTHFVMVPAGPSLVPTLLPHPFTGILDGGLVATVKIGGQPAAVQGSTATNTPSHVPTPPGTSFLRPPSNRATIQTGSATVRIGGKAAARNTDAALTCGDPVDAPAGTVLAAGTVFIGG